MRRWMLVAALPAVVLALFALLNPAHVSRTQQLRAEQQAQAQPAPPETMRVVVGDTFRLRRSTEPRGLVREYRVADNATQFTASPAILQRGPGGFFRAAQPGVATIRVAHSNDPYDVKYVRVLPEAEALTEMVIEVCPNEDEAELRVKKATVSTRVERIHEFHDCQRLIEDSTYSAAVGIFAHEIVGQPPADFRQGAVAATILNFPTKGTSARYAWLGIEPGTSCLVMRIDQSRRWSAAILHHSPTYDPCPNLTWGDVPATLEDSLIVLAGPGFDLLGKPGVPPVARWDWDAKHRRNYIGIACGRATWCEIGPESLLPSAPLTIADPQDPTRRLPLAKGLYDQQLLADSTGKRPSTVFGTLRPGEDAKSAGMMRYRPGPATPKYRVALMEFQETAASMSPDYVRYFKDYIDPNAVPATYHSTSTLTLESRIHTNSRYVYRGEFNKQPLTLDTGIVKRSHSHLHNSTPVVRWRWVVDDERTWSYCAPDGCCENVARLR